MSVLCGNRPKHDGVAVHHHNILEVKECYGLVTLCQWQVERDVCLHEGDEEWPPEWERQVVACGAPVHEDEHGWRCEGGHSYVDMETRWKEGWDYAEDREEAKRLTAAGTEPRDLVTGGAFAW